MTDFDLPADASTRLSGLLSLADENSAAGWSADELAAIWRHQLAVPLLVDLGGVAPDAALTISQATAGEVRKLESFADLLAHPNPPLELLQLAKAFAKRQRTLSGVEGGFPPEIATGLYYMVIALALLRIGRRISEMDDAKLKQGFEWAVRQTWLDAESKALFEAAIADSQT